MKSKEQTEAITYKSDDDDNTPVSKKNLWWNIRRKNGWNTKNEQGN